MCQGDSGGPAFDIFDRVIGVASRGAFDCDNPVYGGVFDQSDWLKKSTLNAADSAGISPPKWALDWPTAPAYSHPVGAACQSGAQCNSNICIDGYCTRVCNENSPCPGGFSCLGQCIVDPEPVIEEGGCNALNSSAAGLLWMLPLLSLLWRRKTAS